MTDGSHLSCSAGICSRRGYCIAACQPCSSSQPRLYRSLLLGLQLGAGNLSLLSGFFKQKTLPLKQLLQSYRGKAIGALRPALAAWQCRRGVFLHHHFKL